MDIIHKAARWIAQATLNRCRADAPMNDNEQQEYFLNIYQRWPGGEVNTRVNMRGSSNRGRSLKTIYSMRNYEPW